MFKITYTTDAINAIDRQQPKLKAQILNVVARLAANPFAKMNKAEPIKGEKDAFRYRIREWRLLYAIDRRSKTLVIVDFKPRGKAYR